MAQQLNPVVVGAIVQLVSNPAFVVEVTVHMLYPDVKAEFDSWLALHRIAPPSGADVYDWWQQKFPVAPVRTEDMNPDEGFRNLFKAIIAKAFNLPDPATGPRIDLSASKGVF